MKRQVRTQIIPIHAGRAELANRRINLAILRYKLTQNKNIKWKPDQSDPKRKVPIKLSEP